MERTRKRVLEKEIKGRESVRERAADSFCKVASASFLSFLCNLCNLVLWNINIFLY